MSNSNTAFIRYVFLDIIGYSKLTIEVQVFIVEALNKVVHTALKDNGVQKKGRVLIPVGDGIGIALLNAAGKYDSHVSLSLSILQRLEEYNQQADEKNKFQMRIGVHQNTDVLVTDVNGKPNVAGTGINVTSRIMGLADGNQILVSRVVYDELYTRELYKERLFKLSSIEVKHGLLLDVYQYIQEDFQGLDCSLPTKWRQNSQDQNKESLPTHQEDSTEIAQIETTNKALIIAESSISKQQLGKRQILETIDALTETIKNEDLILDEFHTLRLQLIASTISGKKFSSSALGVHEANSLYLNRAILIPMASELTALLRMLINDDSGYVPGWYWFREFNGEAIESVIFGIACSDNSNSVRKMAFDLLSLAKVPLPDNARENLSWTITSDSSSEVRRSALVYLGQVGGRDYLSVVGSALVDRERTVNYEASVSKFLILARTEPERALNELLNETGVEVDKITTELSDKANEITTETLLKALDYSKPEIRIFAVKELLKRGEFNNEIAIKLKEDKDDLVKSTAYRFLFQNKFEIEPDHFFIPDNYLERHHTRSTFFERPAHIEHEEIILMYYQRYSFDQLKEMINWQNFYSEDVYLTLGLEYFSEFGEQLREELRNDFKVASADYYQQELEEYRSWNTPERNLVRSAIGWGRANKSTPEEDAKNSVERRKNSHIRVILIGLAKNGLPEDVEFGRRFLFHTDDDVRIEAVRILQKWGNKDDLSDLIKIAKNSNGLLQELAAQAALEISDKELKIVAEFLSTNNEVLISLTMADLISNGDKETVANFLMKYLKDSNDKIRIRAMAFFAFRYNSQELTDLLTEYTNGETYYYDVVCCFDTILYAPPRIGLSYRQSITDKFFGFLTTENISVTN